MTTTCDKCGQPRSDGISEEERAALAAANEDLNFKDDETERMILRAPELVALLREMVDHGECVSLYKRAEALLEFIRTGKP